MLKNNIYNNNVYIVINTFFGLHFRRLVQETSLS